MTRSACGATAPKTPRLRVRDQISPRGGPWAPELAWGARQAGRTWGDGPTQHATQAGPGDSIRVAPVHVRAIPPEDLREARERGHEDGPAEECEHRQRHVDADAADRVRD